jgi:hypothetical protein
MPTAARWFLQDYCGPAVQLMQTRGLEPYVTLIVPSAAAWTIADLLPKDAPGYSFGFCCVIGLHPYGETILRQ